MIEFINTVDIARDPDAVYAYLADLERVPEWNWAIAASTLASGHPASLGARYQFTRSTPRPGTEIVEIIGLEPDRKVVIAGRLGPFGAKLVYELERIPSGTRVTNRVTLRSPPLGPLGDILGGPVRASVADNLDVLRTRLEQGVTGS